jgi:hypothetical protein
MNGTAPDVGGAHPATMKSAATAKAAASTTAGKRVIGNQTGSDEDGCREADQTITNHGILLIVKCRRSAGFQP